MIQEWRKLENKYKQENNNCIYFLEVILKQMKVLSKNFTQTYEQTKNRWKIRKNYFFFSLCCFSVVKCLKIPYDVKFIAKFSCKKAMALHSSTLAWKISWMEEPGRLQSMGSLRVRHDWATSLSLFTYMHWRRKWQPTPVFLPGESQGRGSLVGCCLWGRTESDTTEAT